MRLLIVSPYFPPQRGAASVRLLAIAQEAVKAGIHTDILTTTKEPDQITPWTQSFDGAVYEIQPKISRKLRWLRNENKRDLNDSANQPKRSRFSSSVYQVLSSIRAHTGVFSSVRMPDLTDYWIKPAIEWAREHQRSEGPWDVVLSSSGPYTAHLVALEIKKAAWAKSWVADYRDLWTANHAYSGLLPFTFRERVLERRVLKNVDAVTTVSQPLATWLSDRTHAPIKIIYNGYSDPSQTEPAQSSFSASTSIRLVYTGQLYSKFQDASLLMHAIEALDSTGIDIRLTVAGASSASWDRLARQAGIGSLVDLLGEVSHEQAIELQRNATGLVAFEWKDPAAGVLTNKLFEYIAAGPLVLLTGHKGPMASILTKTGRGIHLGSTADSVERTLRDLIAGNIHLPTPNTEEIQQLSRLNQSKKLINLCKQIIP